MFQFFRKKQEEISRTEPGFEETERKTPKAGIVLLIIMFIAGIFFGWRALDDLAGVPNAPPPLSNCSYSFRSAYVREGLVRPFEPPPLYDEYGRSYYGDSYVGFSDDYSKCRFNDIEVAHGIPALFAKRQPLLTERDSTSRSMANVGTSLRSTQEQIDRLLKLYGIGLEELEERIDDPLFATPQIRGELQTLLAQEESLKTQRTQLENRLTSLDAQIKASDEELRTAYKPVLKEYNRRLRWYDFQVFLLQFVFTLPFFWFSFRGYRRLHGKNSPYTIIMVGVLAVAAILLLRVILFWFWDLFLARVIQELWRWIQNFRILRSIVFYLGMVLSFAVFGGAVYWLQKRIFDPRRVTLRRFRAKQCPRCQTNLDLSVHYCPNCGYQAKEKCAHCGEMRFVDLPVCPYCGSKKT